VKPNIPSIPWNENWNQAVETLFFDPPTPLGKHGQEHLRELVARAIAKNDARELNVF
jgi:hypothetical protein